MSRRARAGGLRLALTLVGMVAVAGCGQTGGEVDPAARTATLTTSACGDASSTRGSGVVVAGDRLLTAAHLVIGAGTITVELPAGGRVEAEPIVVDTTRDLAVLDLGEAVVPDPIELEDVEAGATLWLVGGAVSGDLDAEVLRTAVLVVDEVRGTARHRRGGYELDVSIARGDSGAGVFDTEGRLVGVVFARSADRPGVAFAVDAGEIRAVLDAETSSGWRCDPDRSRIVRSDG